MTTIPLTSALRLLRQFGDNPDTVAVIEKAIAELERLYKVEELAVSFATDYDTGAGIDPNKIEAIQRLQVKR
jgi:hypothetical protein